MGLAANLSEHKLKFINLKFMLSKRYKTNQAEMKVNNKHKANVLSGEIQISTELSCCLIKFHLNYTENLTLQRKSQWTM